LIRSFADSDTDRVFNGERTRLFGLIARQALRKLLMIHAAEVLEDLRSSPGNRLEALRGDRAGQHSIRVNDQWRIVFIWKDDGAYDVEIVDSH
jgi:toxin HigB-1